MAPASHNSPSFVARQVPDRPTPSMIGALDYIAYVQTLNPDIKVIVGSPLYVAATNEYNLLVKSDERPAVPSWYCGKVDPDSGLLMDGLTDVDIRRQLDLSSSTIPSSEASPESPLPYPIDQCLGNGTPGSPGYASCELGRLDDINTGTIHWETSLTLNTMSESSEGGEMGELGGPITWTTGTSPMNIGSVAFDGFDIRKWRQTTTLSASVGGSVGLSYSKAKSWRDVGGVNANCWVIANINGRWRAATWEWLRFGQTSKSKRAVAGDHIKKSSWPSNWRPQSGETIYLAVSGLCRAQSRNVSERSNFAKVRWP